LSRFLCTDCAVISLFKVGDIPLIPRRTVV
jgi:hypothetical protein